MNQVGDLNRRHTHHIWTARDGRIALALGRSTRCRSLRSYPQFLQLHRHTLRKHVEVGGQFAATHDAEVHSVLVGHHRDVQARALSNGPKWEERLDRHTRHEQAERGAWHVGDSDVVEGAVAVGQTERRVQTGCARKHRWRS